MPRPTHEQYECDDDAISSMFEGCDSYREYAEDECDAYEPNIDEDEVNIDEVIDEMQMEESHADEPEPEPEEEVELQLGEIRIDGDKWTANAPNPKLQVDAGLRQAVKVWGETGKPVELEIYIDRTTVRNKETRTYCRKISVMVDRAIELDEAFFPEQLNECDWVRTWLEENDIPGERPKEKERQEGMSWVHMEVKNDGKAVGRITACIRPGESSRHYDISFAFCRGTVPFSKRQGRIISRDRMDNGRIVTVLKNANRYDTVREIFRRTLHGEKLWNCTRDNATQGFPEWLYPNYREDIPEDVTELLEEIYTSIDTKAAVRDRIGPMLSRNIKQRADVELARITEERA